MKVKLIPVLAGYTCSECGAIYTTTEYIKGNAVTMNYGEAYQCYCKWKGENG